MFVESFEKISVSIAGVTQYAKWRDEVRRLAWDWMLDKDDARARRVGDRLRNSSSPIPMLTYLVPHRISMHGSDAVDKYILEMWADSEEDTLEDVIDRYERMRGHKAPRRRRSRVQPEQVYEFLSRHPEQPWIKQMFSVNAGGRQRKGHQFQPRKDSILFAATNYPHRPIGVGDVVCALRDDALRCNPNFGRLGRMHTMCIMRTTTYPWILKHHAGFTDGVYVIYGKNQENQEKKKEGQ